MCNQVSVFLLFFYHHIPVSYRITSGVNTGEDQGLITDFIFTTVLLKT